MRKITLIIFILGFCLHSNSQDLISGGSNSWLFHTPDDGRTFLAIAPMINGEWSWANKTTFTNNGNVYFTEDVLLNGRLGVGNTSPQEKFQIGSSYSFHIGGHDVIGFMYQPSGDVDLDNSLYAAEIRFEKVAGKLRFGISNDVTSRPTTKLVITKDGVGIGTSSPSESLDVNGTIHTREVRVDLTGWPDFVFNGNYKLPALKEVEKYIKENGHLQNIPSAKEVEKEGIKLGEMNALLLQKIEELTLYIIEQEKRITELENKNLSNDAKK